MAATAATAILAAAVNSLVVRLPDKLLVLPTMGGTPIIWLLRLQLWPQFRMACPPRKQGR